MSEMNDLIRAAAGRGPVEPEEEEREPTAADFDGGARQSLPSEPRMDDVLRAGLDRIRGGRGA